MHRRYALGDLRPPLRRHLLRSPQLIAKYPCWWLWWGMVDSDCWSGKGSPARRNGGSASIYDSGDGTA